MNITAHLDPVYHADIIEWAASAPPEALTHAFVMGYTVYTSGLAEYYRTYHRVDATCLRDLETELKARIAENAGDAAAIEERISKRVRNETQTLADDCAYAQQQLARQRAEFERIVDERVASRLVAEKAALEAELSAQSRIVESLQSQIQAVSTRAATEVAFYHEKLEAASREVVVLGHKFAEAMHSEEMARLRAELQILKGSNSVKCIIGETLLSDVIQAALPMWEVVHKGKTPHECDIHVVNSQGEIIMVESKYKKTIEREDVDKFVADIAHMDSTKRPYLGAIFVSIKKATIPHKGSVCLEIVHRRPVLYLGFAGEDELQQQLPMYIGVFVQYCQVMRNIVQVADENADADIDALFEAVNEHFKATHPIKMHVARLQRQHQESARTIADVEKSILALSSSMEAFLQKHDRIAPAHVQIQTRTQAQAHPTAALSKTYVCEVCSEKFSNKRKHGMHVKECTAS